MVKEEGSNDIHFPLLHVLRAAFLKRQTKKDNTEKPRDQMHLYHNISANCQQEPPTLHFFSSNKRKELCTEFLFCGLMKTWRI